MSKNKTYQDYIFIALLTAVIIFFLPVISVKGETAAAVSIGIINYEFMTLQVYNNNNSIVYYSTDNNIWTEVDGAYSSITKSYTMDISWISPDKEVTLYFKGNSVKTVKSITLPMQNSSFSVDYDKVEGTFTFNDAEEADSFEWRKNTDYYWRSVNLDEGSSSYNSFLRTIEKLKATGATIIIRLPQVIGTGADNVGMRASVEKSVTITARPAAPVVKINAAKLTLNTTTAMEYYDPYSDLWIECTSNMSLYDIAPQVLNENGATAATVKIRKAATTSTPYSKIATLFIPAQKAAPKIGDSSSDVTYYFMNSKLILQFNKASSTEVYEYYIVRDGNDFDAATASWKSVKTTDIITISNSAAPDGSTVYVRKKGIDSDSGSTVVLASDINSFDVEY